MVVRTILPDRLTNHCRIILIIGIIRIANGPGPETDGQIKGQPMKVQTRIQLLQFPRSLNHRHCLPRSIVRLDMKRILLHIHHFVNTVIVRIKIGARNGPIFVAAML